MFALSNPSCLPPLRNFTQAKWNRKLLLWSLHSHTQRLEKVMTKRARGLQLKAELLTQGFHSHASASGILWVLTTVLNMRLLTCVRWSTPIFKKFVLACTVTDLPGTVFIILGFQRAKGKCDQLVATPYNHKGTT